AGAKYEAGGLEVAGIGVDECAGGLMDRGGVGAMPDGEGQLVLCDQRAGGDLVVDRQRDDFDIEPVESVSGALEGAQLRVAVRTPRAAVEQDDGEVVCERLGEVDHVAVDRGERDGWKAVAGVEQWHLSCGSSRRSAGRRV